MEDAPCSPSLGNIGSSRVEDRKIDDSLALHPSEHFWGTVRVKAFNGVEDAADHFVCFICQSVALESIGNNAVVLRPHRTSLIGKGVICRILVGECTYAPATPHIVLSQSFGCTF